MLKDSAGHQYPACSAASTTASDEVALPSEQTASTGLRNITFDGFRFDGDEYIY